jgi:uncharacterized protein
VIEIKIETDKYKVLKSLIVKGHSNFDIYGKDLVCASVSILVYSFYLSLIDLPLVTIDYKDEENDFKIEIKKLNENLIGELRGFTIFLVKGLKSLAQNFKENIKLNLLEN